MPLHDVSSIAAACHQIVTLAVARSITSSVSNPSTTLSPSKAIDGSLFVDAIEAARRAGAIVSIVTMELSFVHVL